MVSLHGREDQGNGSEKEKLENLASWHDMKSWVILHDKCKHNSLVQNWEDWSRLIAPESYFRRYQPSRVRCADVEHLIDARAHGSLSNLGDLCQFAQCMLPFFLSLEWSYKGHRPLMNVLPTVG